MPGGDRTGPIGRGKRDGSGRRLGGRGQTSKAKGAGAKKGGRKGRCR